MNEAETAICHLLGVTRTDLYLGKAKGFTAHTCRTLSGILKRRIAGEPLQYILGETEFMGLPIVVTPDVLIPRPETEILVETVMRVVAGPQSRQVTGPRILDVGTGSGCIAIALAKLLPHASVEAIDVSGAALAVARRNAQLNGVAVSFTQQGVGAYRSPRGSYDCIVSNPPYVAAPDIPLLQPEVSHEPRIALDGGADGCAFYRQLIPWALPYLCEEGFLVLEMGCGQRTIIEDSIEKTRGFTIVEIVKDYSDIERVMVCRTNRATVSKRG